MKSLSYSLYKLSDKDTDRLLELDSLFNDMTMHYRNDCDTKTVLNLDEECKKFLKARSKGQRYYPFLKRPECKFSDDFAQKNVWLCNEFRSFNCFLSRYYVELLNAQVTKIKFLQHPTDEALRRWYCQYQAQRPSRAQYDAAMSMLRQNPYEEIDESDRTIDAIKAQKIIQDYINQLGYKWDVRIKEDMIPRMSVEPNQIMNIKKDAMFSPTDMEGLKWHEVRGHIGRRYYGLKTGLYLFLHGLLWRNTLDEGLAIWNSLHMVDKVKPNVRFNIALKTIIARNLDMDFCDLFEFCHELSPEMPLDTLFSTIARYKREVQDCSIRGGNGDDQSYFCGYQIVSKMDDKGRDDILKINCGPGQIKMIPEIKTFLEINGFDPLI